MQSFDQQLQMPHPTLLIILCHGCWDMIMKIDPKVYMYSDSEIMCLDSGLDLDLESGPGNGSICN